MEEFKRYVNKFYTGNEDNDKGIKLKYDHSLRVKDRMHELALDLGFDDEKIRLAEIIGLLHDYGRFYQWKEYQTFNDGVSIDHAFYGACELFDEGEIVKYYDIEENYDVIKEAIYYHNKYDSPNDIFSLMIRDADKLDILHLFEDELSFKEEGDISIEVLSDFNNERLVDYKNIKTSADKVLKELAYVFDLNYLYSFKYIKENKIIDNIYKRIKDKEKFKGYFDKINNYIDKKIEEMKVC